MNKVKILQTFLLFTQFLCLFGIVYFYFAYQLSFDAFQYKEKNFMHNGKFKDIVLKLRKILGQLTTTKYFKYFRVDLTQKCLFSQNEAVCRSRTYCELKCPCPLNQLPKNWIVEDEREKEKQLFSVLPMQDFIKPIQGQEDEDHSWSFDKVTDNVIYIDLTKDREMWTKYQGQYIWKIIYNENCLSIHTTCVKNNILYRLISGMHASISSHLTYFQPDIKLGLKKITASVPMYYKMVGGHKHYLKNLVYSVRFMLRSLIRKIDLIQNFSIDTGDFQEDMKTKKLLDQIVQLMYQYKDYDDETSSAFTLDISKEVQRNMYLRYFRNITRIMDCVDCTKCKAYGKMQVLGIGVALRGLLNDDKSQMSRNEMVAFFNTIDKWIESLEIIDFMKVEIKWYKGRNISIFVIIFIIVYGIQQLILKKTKKRDQKAKDKGKRGEKSGNEEKKRKKEKFE